MKILIVDDNPEFASIVQEMLKAEGHEIRLAADGRFGYLAYLVFQPDLVITDLQMPGENGLELVRQIRRHDANVKTIYMSGDLRPFSSLVEEEKKSYPVSFLQKPFSKAELMRSISEFLS